METVVTPATPEEVPVRGYGQTLMDLFIAPGDAFSDVVRRPRILIPLAIIIVLNVALIWTWLGHADLYEFVRAQAEAGGNPAPPHDKVPYGFVRGIFWFAGICAPLIFNVILAGIFLLVFNFMLGAQAKFKTVLSVLLHAGLALGLVTVPLMLVTFTLKGDWNVPPDQILQASAAAFLDKATTSKALYALAGSFDVFAIWLATMMSIGLGRATSRSTGSAATVVFTLWAIVILLKVGWFAIFR